MALLHELKEFRSKINQKLCSDQKIVDLINDKPNSPIPDRDLMYKRIYPYAYTPEAVKDTGTFICHRIYVPDVMNKTFKKMSVVFYIFVHQDNIRTSDGLRYDLIAERIEELFNGTMELGVGILVLLLNFMGFRWSILFRSLIVLLLVAIRGLVLKYDSKAKFT